jgi:histidine triad (HIT) family protein
MKDCLFCKIVKEEEQAEKVFENDDFIVIKNKFPIAPIHLLLIPKIHISKQDSLLGLDFDVWESFFRTQKLVVEELKISPNYQLLVNAPGYAHFDHEHMHIISGLDQPLG